MLAFLLNYYEIRKLLDKTMTQRPSRSTRLFSLFLSGILLLLAAGGPVWTQVQTTVPESVAEAQKAKKTAEAPAETVVKAASFEAVVTPAVSFGFAQAVYLLPPVVRFLAAQPAKLPRLFEVPYYYFSYFRHVFGHHIATNAP